VPPSEDIGEVLVRVAKDGATSSGGTTDLIEKPAGLAELPRVDRVGNEGIDLRLRHQGVKRDRIHVHPAVGGAGAIRRRPSPGAASEVVLPGSVEALQSVGGLRDARVVVAVKETSCVSPGHALSVLDESPEISASPALGCLPALAGKEAE
jgi:hypothetical protein